MHRAAGPIGVVIVNDLRCASGALLALVAFPIPHDRWPLLAIFSMLCTRQNSRHCVPTLSLPRSVKRLSRLLWRRLANTGSTVAMRWL